MSSEAPEKGGEFLVRCYHDGDRAEVEKFLRECFSDDAVQNLPGWLDWQLGHPLGPTFVLIIAGERLAGWSVFLKVRVVVDGHEFTGAFATNTMVHPDFRRRGLGTMLHDYRIRNYDFALSCGQSMANHRLYTKLGFAVLEDYRQCIINRSFPRPYLARRYLRELVAWSGWVRSSHAGVGELEPMETIPDTLPASWFESRTASGHVRFLHGVDYLRWRYQDHPHIRYRLVSVRHGNEAIGLAAYHLDEDKTVISEIFCEAGDLTRCVGTLAAGLPGRHIESVFTGDATTAAFRACGGHIFSLGVGHGQELMGDTRKEELKPLLDREWDIWLGDADKER